MGMPASRSEDSGETPDEERYSTMDVVLRMSAVVLLAVLPGFGRHWFVIAGAQTSTAMLYATSYAWPVEPERWISVQTLFYPIWALIVTAAYLLGVMLYADHAFPVVIYCFEKILERYSFGESTTDELKMAVPSPRVEEKDGEDED